MSSIACENHEFKLDLRRNLAVFQPNIWGEHFLQYASESMEVDQNIGSKIETLKKNVRDLLYSKTEKLLTKVHLIDSINRLGVSYHFEEEIEEILQHIHNNHVENDNIITFENNLCSLAVLFRLLRQQGFHISPNVFNKFKNEDGKFSEKIIRDVEGMLSLYEATHLMVHGEDILEEALTFTTTHLESIAREVTHPYAIQVKHSLRQALHKNFPRLEARSYISYYDQNPSHNEHLLLLAKLDFNMLQTQHQKEFGNLCKWWMELDVASKLPYARNRIGESCLWTLGIYYEPRYSIARRIMTKLIVIITMIDDTYDAYGTIDELELFTKAIERWDISCLDILPDYMKFLYKIIMDHYKDIEQEMIKEGRVYALKYYVQKYIKYVQSYMTEARWLSNKYEPTYEEYIHVSKESSGYTLVATTCVIGLGHTATEDIFKWLSDEPQMINASIVLCRLMDDIVSNEFEQRREHLPSFLECYMRKYNIPREDAIKEGQKKIDDAWKDINQECLLPTEVPMPFMTRLLNLSRVMDVFYKDKDNFTHPDGEMKAFVKASLVDSVPI